MERYRSTKPSTAVRETGRRLFLLRQLLILQVIHGLNSARWTVDTLPSDWSSIRNRWEAFHAARTFISLAGFGSALAAARWSRDTAAPPV